MRGTKTPNGALPAKQNVSSSCSPMFALLAPGNTTRGRRVELLLLQFPPSGRASPLGTPGRQAAWSGLNRFMSSEATSGCKVTPRKNYEDASGDEWRTESADGAPRKTRRPSSAKWRATGARGKHRAECTGAARHTITSSSPIQPRLVAPTPRSTPSASARRYMRPPAPGPTVGVQRGGCLSDVGQPVGLRPLGGRWRARLRSRGPHQRFHTS